MTADREGPQPARRDFVVVSAGAFAAVGAVLALWPFVAHMSPAADVAVPSLTDIDLRAIAPGQTITVRWHGKPIFIRHRTVAEIEGAQVFEADKFRDPYARNAALPPQALAHDKNRTQAGHARWLIVVGVCPHLNCVLTASDGTTVGESWICPCHNARFDLAGRVLSGPALTNLEIPKYSFPNASTLRLG